MSNLEREPAERTVCDGPVAVAAEPAAERLEPREVPLGGPRDMLVRRSLPNRYRRMVGAWCFADAYGPADLTRRPGMRVPPHPHIGLQTVSWLVQELIMVASGFDASANDPLGRMMVTASGYRRIARALVELAEEVCDGRLVCSHEGGYSPVYVPFYGLAVLEALSGHETGVIDPFAASWDDKPQHAVTPWQTEVIEAAGALADRLRLA